MKGKDEGRGARVLSGAESFSIGALTTRATPVSRLSLDREKMSRPRQLGKIVSPPPSFSPSSSFPDEKGSSSLSESIGRHEQKPWSRMYVRARVYSVHSSLRLYVSGRTRKRVGEVERGEKAGERWNRVDGREERGDPE